MRGHYDMISILRLEGIHYEIVGPGSITPFQHRDHVQLCSMIRTE